MQYPIKKTSTKIFVDEYDKFCQGYDLSKKPQKTEQKKVAYHRYVDEELSEEATQICLNHQEFNKKRHEEEKYREKNVISYPSQVTSQNLYEFLSEEDEDNLKILLERRHNKDPKSIIKNIIFPQKKEEVHHRQKNEFKDSEYFPQQFYQKSKLEPEVAVRQKRPNSSMIGKNLPKSTNQKNEKEKQEKLKKTQSTSKFKEDNKRVNQSSHKDRQNLQSANPKNPQTFKNNVTLRRQVSNQYQDPAINRLKKKTVNMISKPLKIEEVQKNKYNLINKVSKINPNGQQMEQRQRIPEQNRECMNIRMKELRKREKSERQESETHQKIHQQNRFEHINRENLREREKQQIRHHHQPPNREDQRRQRETPRQQPVSRNNQRRGRDQRPRQQQRPRQEERPRHQRRNNRNPRNQSSSSRRSPHPHNFLNFFSRTINDQLELMNSQFSMMSNIFQNFSNFVNINIDSHGNHFHISTNMDSSDEYTDSSESYSSDYDDYYQNDQEPEGLNESELDKIERLRYRVSQLGNNQCTICLIELKNGDEAKKLFCEHIFHSDCIDEWLKRKSDCPVCRDKQ